MSYFAYWIDRLRLADALPSGLAHHVGRTALHEAPPACRPAPVEAWLFDLATDHGDGLDGAHVVGWLRLRRVLGDDTGVLDPETARYWYEQLGTPPKRSEPRWTRACRRVARSAEPLGFGLSPRLVAAFGDHPAWVRPYLRCATFKAWRVAADDPARATLPPPSRRSISAQREGAGAGRPRPPIREPALRSGRFPVNQDRRSRLARRNV